MIVDRDIKTAIKNKTVVIGTRQVLKGIKQGMIAQAVYASNCPAETVKDLTYYAQTATLEVAPCADNSAKLGEICGKPFTVSVVGIKAEAKKRTK